MNRRQQVIDEINAAIDPNDPRKTLANLIGLCHRYAPADPPPPPDDAVTELAPWSVHPRIEIDEGI